ncbi:hypothetical protein P3X46_024100 [Hevea brasiliensis]|uniref:Serine-rich protein-related n=1 Tax=Hevea brasiliensis TaxID=3981 RepID=I3NMS2_HEVBR|nr:uncharacterized protein LOC110671477 [Hevea brasiliensis]ADR71309.1 hypothetical protein 31 [Hevea brasiliensis]KAJ9164535.1 hypothetical protein P3X46_024100 [Hevea brasiliensis]
MASKRAPSDSKSQQQQSAQGRICLCSPTKHPGSFRCSLHRNFRRVPGRSSSSNKGELAVIAKANSLRAFLLQIIKPSSHDLQRRRNFRPRPSRFCLMNANRDGFAVS